MNGSARRLASIGCLVLALAGCDDKSTSIAPDGYDTSCGQDSDCVLVVFGERCPCACASGAINRADEAKYRAEVAGKPCTEKVYCGPCEDVTPRCLQNRCAVTSKAHPDAGRPDSRADGGGGKDAAGGA